MALTNSNFIALKEKEYALSHEYLLSILDYNPETGIFKWKYANKLRRDSPNIGDIAGTTIDYKGYSNIVIGQNVYKAHRLAWFYQYGKWPDDNMEIDHIDGNPLNNKINNLRLVSGMQNSRNRKMHINNTSGHTGVYWHKKHQKWVAAIGNGKRKNVRALYDCLGYFDNYEDDVKAREAAEIKYNYTQPKR